MDPSAPPTRLFHSGPLAAGGPVRLDPESSHHALRVLRLQPGDRVELFDGSGARWPGRLVDTDPRGASVELGEPIEAATESPLSIGLAQALPSGDKMDWVVEKAVELGAVAIQPLFSRRSLLKLDGDRAAKRLAHWRRIALAACMQCGRDRVPDIAEPVALSRWLATAAPLPAPAGGQPGTSAQAAQPPAPLRLVLSPRGRTGLSGIALSGGSAWLLAGPEGGLADEEEALALEAGWHPLRLGPRVLRTETAGLAAIAALQARFGDFG
jgi:16S rRNA (uracil1498-N3)-methyltransferase